MVLDAAPTIKVIMVTGNGDQRTSSKSRILGAFDFLQKPVRATDSFQMPFTAHWTSAPEPVHKAQQKKVLLKNHTLGPIAFSLAT
jgi:FixJ family two-component response regulator